MFRVQYTSPEEDVFTTHMKDLILTSVLAGTFGTMLALLVPYGDRQIHEVTSAMARLEDMEVKRKECSTQVCALLLNALQDRLVHGQRRGGKAGAEQRPDP